jgi:hypothetical protein
MAFDCIVVNHGLPTTLPSRYVVVSGDTLTAIARRFGFASWRDIYYHAENTPFRHKRPNPDKIFPGDELVIPGHPADPSQLAALGFAPGGGIPFVHVPMAFRLQGLTAALAPGAALQDASLSLKGGGKPKSTQFDTNYKHPGNVKIRLTLFWLSNCVDIDTSPQVSIAKAIELYAPHGIGVDILPSTTRNEKHTIKVPDTPLLPEQYNSVRLEAGLRFDDQKTADKKQRLPIFFGEFKDPANGLTVIGNWPAYVFVSGVQSPDKATLAHEIMHGAGFVGHDKANQKNILAEVTSSRGEMYKFQIQQLASSYFCK